jgi:Predicted membrane protein
MYNLISWIVFGLVAGVIAKLLMPGRDPGGCVITMILGIAGAVIGGFLAQLLGIAGETGRFGDRGFLIRLVFAVLGAVVILAVYRMIAAKRA